MTNETACVSFFLKFLENSMHVMCENTVLAGREMDRLDDRVVATGVESGLGHVGLPPRRTSRSRNRVYPRCGANHRATAPTWPRRLPGPTAGTERPHGGDHPQTGRRGEPLARPPGGIAPPRESDPRTGHQSSATVTVLSSV